MTPFEAYLESDQADWDFNEWCAYWHGHSVPSSWCRARWERTADCSDKAQAWIDSEGDEHRLEQWERDRAEGLT